MLPLQFEPDASVARLGLTGAELLDITGVSGQLEPGQAVTVHARGAANGELSFEARVRLDTPAEVEYYLNSGVLHAILRRLVALDRNR